MDQKKSYKILLLTITLILPLIIISCDNENETINKSQKEYTGNPQIEFLNTSYDFGTLKEGEKVECTFRYKNTGTAPLKIIYVDADCGCTIPEYSDDEILPGESGKIKAVFNSEGFRNNIYKTISVETNAGSELIELAITAYIENNITLN